MSVGAAMSRDEARAAWAATGLTLGDLTPRDIEDLHRSLDEALKASGLIGGTFGVEGLPSIEGTPERPYVSFRCRSRYFDGRELVTIEGRAFVGFAGWADDENVAPILEAFVAWARSTAETRDRLAP